ncbi:MAG: glycoside hydrolase family 3 N-terminal domain-containing protein [Bacteroidota bacterium]
MRRILFLLGFLAALTLLVGWTPEPAIPSEDQEIAKKVKELLAKMDLMDKVGEMTQVTLDVISVGEPYNVPDPHRLDSAKLREALVKYRVGSVLNCSGHEYSLEHWREIITTIQRIATTEKESGIPVLYGIDAIHGVNYTEGANLHPQQIGLAATFDPNLAKQLAQMTAYQCRASYIPWTFAPVLDIGRDARWPRLWETFGEDVFLASRMGEAFVQGFEGDDLKDETQVASCMKHFLGYSTTLRGKDRTQAWIPERQLREYFVPTFQAAVDAGASTIMICSGEMNGIPVHANKAILTDLLRKDMGFEGLAVSDWADIHYLYQRHGVAKDYKDAIRMAVNAGIDMSMTPVDIEFPKLLKELVEEGKVPMSRIDEAVTRILTLKFRLGLFENPTPKMEYTDWGAEEWSNLCLNAARDALVLAKNNDKVLPLKKTSRVLVTGPTANSLIPLNGGWTHNWQGDDASRQTKGKKNILQAIQAEIGEGNVKYVQGTSINDEVNIKAAVKAAKKSDVIVLCLGEMSYTETPGDRPSMNLPLAQQRLVKALAKTGKPMVAVMTEGRPRIISMIEEELDGIVIALLPGDEGGIAISDLLFGNINPSGKLPITYPRSSNDLIVYDHKGTDRVGPLGFSPQFEFGHGLSYTTFETSGLKLNAKSYRKNDPIEVSVKVKNTGKVAGEEVVMVYVRDKVASITPPVKRLRAFDKVLLMAGESKDLTFTILPSELSFIGVENEWTLEEGMFEVMVGEEKVEFELK